jgi:hypothetical protein
MFLHHRMKDGGFPRQLSSEQVYQVDLARKREPLEVLADVERSIRAIEISQRAALQALLRVNRPRHVVNPSPVDKSHA